MENRKHTLWCETSSWHPISYSLPRFSQSQCPLINTQSSPLLSEEGFLVQKFECKMASENRENVNIFMQVLGCWEKTGNVVTRTAQEGKRLAEEDPRRVVHSFKVGLAITAVSLLYYFDFCFHGFGVSAMWAVMSVVVVFEFSVGATLGKGVNRGIATFLGGALGVAVHRLASFAGERIEVIVLGVSVFFIASIATFFRFYPKLRARYDYGLLIFILTFSLISVSGYRDDEIIDMAKNRLTTILIGGSAAVLICILICPVWAGEDLHKITASNLEKIAYSLEGFGCTYFQEQNEKNKENQELLSEYKSVLNSKTVEDNLVNFAQWEPRHSKFRYRQPWEQYLKIGSLGRECAYKVDALNVFLNSDVQTPFELRKRIQEPCNKMSSECSYALRELAHGIKTMTCSPAPDPHIENAISAVKKLKSSIKMGLWHETDLLDIIPAVTVASLLIEIVSCTVEIAESVHELASLSRFKKREAKMERLKRTPSIEGSHNFNIIVE